MAHRNIKITRDIVQTCNKLRVFNKLDQNILQPHQSTETSKNISPNVKSNKLHYSASCKNEATNPDTILSKVLTHKYANGNAESSFLEPINSLPKTKCSVLNIKHFETDLIISGTTSLPLTTAARLYSSSSKNHKNSEQSCKPTKKCVRNPHCPKFSIEDCAPSKGSNCKRLYQDPCCTKKMAPYPSYSELCAFRMEEDPSECHQCPWQKCRGVDDIKPQGKKSYHTSTKEMNMAMIPTKSTNLLPFVFQKQCDAKKEPCKEPPPKCKKEEKVQKEKCPEKKKKPEKKCESLFLSSQPWFICGSLRSLELQKLYYSKMKLDSLQEKIVQPLNIAQKILYRLKDCPEERKKCPKHQIVPPRVDHRINDNYISIFAKEHDKGHPPPCEPTTKPSSRQCPADTPVKKYKKERDLNEAEYRRIPKPYSDDDRKK